MSECIKYENLNQEDIKLILTEKEYEILNLYSSGLNKKLIANKLNLKENSLNTRISDINRKLREYSYVEDKRMYYLDRRVFNELRRKGIKNLDKLNDKDFLNNLYRIPNIKNKMFFNIIKVCDKFNVKYDAFAKLLNIDVNNIENIERDKNDKIFYSILGDKIKNGEGKDIIDYINNKIYN